MTDLNDAECDVPVLTIPDDIYNAILLADGALVVAQGDGAPNRASHTRSRLPDFFEVRRCLLTAGRPAPRVNRVSGGEIALMKCMVGG